MANDIVSNSSNCATDDDINKWLDGKYIRPIVFNKISRNDINKHEKVFETHSEFLQVINLSPGFTTDTGYRWRLHMHKAYDSLWQQF